MGQESEIFASLNKSGNIGPLILHEVDIERGNVCVISSIICFYNGSLLMINSRLGFHSVKYPH